MIDRTGEIVVSCDGEEAKIINYRGSRDVDISFEDGIILKNLQYGNLKRNRFRNPYFKSMYGLGFIGQGNYVATLDGKHTFLYEKWSNMFSRCYSKSVLKSRETYEKCEVCEEWHNFQNFAEWFENNVWSNDCIVLDKDILIKGNKVYSPYTCVLVNLELNGLFTKRDAGRGKYPIGVTFFRGRYLARCGVKGENIVIGNFSNPTDAFYAYKDFKERHIKQIADEYKEKYLNFPQNLYKAMYKYKVDIED